MNTPPLLLACAALFWSWQTGQWLVAIAAALLLETPRISKQRWHLDVADFNRLADFCALGVLALVAYLYFSFGNPRAVTLLFQWLPIAVLPLAAAQAWSTSREIDLSVLFRSLRRMKLRRPTRLNLGYPYFMLWLLAASAANARTNWFYVGLAAMIAWPLALARPRSFHFLTWVGMVVCVAWLGYGAHVGLHAAQIWLEGAGAEWFAADGMRTDPYRSQTDIGMIGELKLSERIVLRVSADDSFRIPILLHRASYDDYVAGTWIARNGLFEQLVPSGDPSSWSLQTGAATARLTVHDYAPRGNPVLSLPAGTVRVEALAVASVKRNPLGTVQAASPPGYLSYRAEVNRETFSEAPPSPVDLKISGSEMPAIRHVVEQLRLTALGSEQAVQAVQRYFAEGFKYAIYQQQRSGRYAPLSEFLFSTRAGHCEYFATATVLLLRAAGVPARYATGFSVQERSRLEGSYVARARHAHAWARVYVDGRWRDLDTTPPLWDWVEETHAPFWSPLSDLISWARFALASSSTRASGADLYRYLLVPTSLLLAWFVWRTLRARAVRAVGAEDSGTGHQLVRAGIDSEFYLVEQRIGELGWRRDASEPIADWIERLPPHAELEPRTLFELARLHYRYRFDPLGLAEHERIRLRQMAFAWLTRHSVKSAARWSEPCKSV